MERGCRELEVSRSGYYAWLDRKPSERSRRNQALRRRLIELHEKYPAMGLDSLQQILKSEFGCSRKWVHRQMQYPTRAAAQNDVFAYLETFDNSVVLIPP